MEAMYLSRYYMVCKEATLKNFFCHIYWKMYFLCVVSPAEKSLDWDIQS